MPADFFSGGKEPSVGLSGLTAVTDQNSGMLVKAERQAYHAWPCSAMAGPLGGQISSESFICPLPLSSTLTSQTATMDVTEPLLGTRREPAKDRCRSVAGSDIVDFDPTGDVENPMEWTPAFKWVIVGLLATMAFTV